VFNYKRQYILYIFRAGNKTKINNKYPSGVGL
jgi:hypothetical protein